MKYEKFLKKKAILTIKKMKAIKVQGFEEEDNSMEVEEEELEEEEEEDVEEKEEITKEQDSEEIMDIEVLTQTGEERKNIEESIVEQVFEDSRILQDEYSIVAQVGRNTITKKSFDQLLEKEGWFTDEIINAFIEIL